MADIRRNGWPAWLGISGRLASEYAIRELQRKANDEQRQRLAVLLERAERIRSQKPKDKNKLYALHAPEVECIGKGKARQPYEFGVKVGIAVAAKKGLVIGAEGVKKFVCEACHATFQEHVCHARRRR